MLCLDLDLGCNPDGIPQAIPANVIVNDNCNARAQRPDRCSRRGAWSRRLKSGRTRGAILEGRVPSTRGYTTKMWERRTNTRFQPGSVILLLPFHAYVFSFQYPFMCQHLAPDVIAPVWMRRLSTLAWTPCWAIHVVGLPLEAGNSKLLLGVAMSTSPLSRITRCQIPIASRYATGNVCLSAGPKYLSNTGTKYRRGMYLPLQETYKSRPAQGEIEQTKPPVLLGRPS